MKLSALILTKDEEEMIEGCLGQLGFADEIIILDQNSTDNTVNIAQKYTNKILETNECNFGKNRNILAREARGEWLLYIDSDERYSEELKLEIQRSVKNKNISAFLGPQSSPDSTRTAEYSAFYIPRKNIVLGKWMKHGGFWPDYVPKIFRRKDLIGWHGAVHESPEYVGKSGKLKNPINHLTARRINTMFEKTIKWAEIEANLTYKAKHPKVSIIKVLKASFTEFITRYFIKLGLLDGVVGLIQSIFQSYHKSITLVYLWELQTKSKDNINE